MNNGAQVAGDLRWVAARVRRFGAVAPIVDLTAVGTPGARSRKGGTRSNCAPTRSYRAGSCGRSNIAEPVAGQPDLGRPGQAAAGLFGSSRTGEPQAAAGHATSSAPQCLEWPPEPGDIARRGAGRPVARQRIGRRGAIWEMDTGRLLTTLNVRPGLFSWWWSEGERVAIAPDGTWLALVASSRRVELWGCNNRSLSLHLAHAKGRLSADSRQP